MKNEKIKTTMQNAKLKFLVFNCGFTFSILNF